MLKADEGELGSRDSEDGETVEHALDGGVIDTVESGRGKRL